MLGNFFGDFGDSGPSRRRDAAFNHFGDLDAPFGMMGGLMEQMQQMQQGGAAAGGNSSCCFSSYSCCTQGGPDGRAVTYSSTTSGAKRGNEPMVRETQRAYWDSATGKERLGVSRAIGERERSIVAERDADGHETNTQTLMHIEDASAFDREWQETAARSHLPSAARLGSSVFPPTTARPMLSRNDREQIAQGRITHERQTARMAQTAREQREQQHYPGLRPAQGRGWA